MANVFQCDVPACKSVSDKAGDLVLVAKVQEGAAPNVPKKFEMCPKCYAKVERALGLSKDA
jgi:hypothetical protein